MFYFLSLFGYIHPLDVYEVITRNTQLTNSITHKLTNLRAHKLTNLQAQ